MIIDYYLETKNDSDVWVRSAFAVENGYFSHTEDYDDALIQFQTAKGRGGNFRLMRRTRAETTEVLADSTL